MCVCVCVCVCWGSKCKFGLEAGEGGEVYERSAGGGGGGGCVHACFNRGGKGERVSSCLEGKKEVGGGERENNT